MWCDCLLFGQLKCYVFQYFSVIFGPENKRTECEPSQFGSSREHIAAANAASKGLSTVFVWTLNVYIYCKLE